MSPPLLLGFGVFVLGWALLVATCWAVPLSLLVAYGFAWLRRAQPGSRLARMLVAGSLALVASGVAGVVLLFMTMEGDAGRGVDVLGRPLGDPLLLAPALATPPLLVAGELLFRRAGSSPPP